MEMLKCKSITGAYL